MRRQDQQRLVGQRSLEGRRRALEAGLDAGRQPDLLLRLLDGLDGVAQRDAGRQIERQRDRRELPLVIDRQRRIGALEA